MTVALPTGVDDYPRPNAPEHGLVAVLHYGIGNSTAVCSCGWTGRRRHLKAAAQQDAWMHAMDEKCEISTPLVVEVPSVVASTEIA